MRRGTLPALAGCALALAFAACGGPDASGGPNAGGVPAGMEGDAGLIAAAQEISTAMGGCASDEAARPESKVVGLGDGAIVMLGCNQDDASTTHRLFSVRSGAKPELLLFPDYNRAGWFATDKVSMAEIDAGTGVLQTFRRAAANGSCGSEGQYEWNGTTFVLQELRWSDCADTIDAPPFPIVWPPQQGATTDADTATPAP